MLSFLLKSRLNAVTLLVSLGAYAVTAQAPTGTFQQPASSPSKTVIGESTKLAVPSGKGAGKESWLEWNLRTLVGDYERIGQKNAKWDAPAKKALEAFARATSTPLLENDESETAHIAPLQEAIQAGCSDPVIRYLHLRLLHATKIPPDAAQYRDVAMRTTYSLYSDVRKFYASMRAAEMLDSAEDNVINRRESLQFWRATTNHLNRMVQDANTPADGLVKCFDDLFEATRGNPTRFESFYQMLEPAMFKSRPESHVPHLIRGKFNINWAWAARGNGYADSVTEQGWKLFGERLKLAEQSLQKAWDINPTDPRIPYEMINVELGQGNGRDRMEIWFNRAMKLVPNGVRVCVCKLHYLQPKWHGSSEEMVAFGRECLESKDWGGSVPLILVEAHKSAAISSGSSVAGGPYWRQPAVWNDIKNSYEKFSRLNPKSSITKPGLARYAYLCGQWAELNQILKQIGPVTDYTPFGGQIFFDKMVKAAEENTGKK